MTLFFLTQRQRDRDKNCCFVLSSLFQSWSVFFILVLNILPAFAGEKPVIKMVAPVQSRPKIMDTDPSKWRKDPFASVGKKKQYATMGNKQGNKPFVLKTGLKTDKKEVEPEEELILQGIMKADKSSYHALINGRTVKVGDHIGNQTVSEISRYGVKVLSDKKEVTSYDIYQGKLDRGTK